MSENNKKLSEKNNIDKYKNRRKMAWFSFIFAMLHILFCFTPGLPAEGVKNAINVLPYSLTFYASIIAAYIGSASFNDKWELNK